MKHNRKFLLFLVIASSALLSSCGVPIALRFNQGGQSLNFSSDAKGGLSIDVESFK